MRSIRLKIAILITLLTSTAIYASDNGLSVMEFLNVSVSARNAGTGEALASLSDGVIASYYNPAGLTMADNYQIAAMHSEWFQDLRYEFVGLAMPAGRNGNFGASFSYLGLGEINGYSSSNVPTGAINAFDWSFGMAYGRRMTERFSLGAGAKIINERLDDVTAFGYAADLGAQYRTNRVGLGLGLMNIGPNVKYDQVSSPLPSRIETGLAYWPSGKQLALLTGVGVPFRGKISLKAGIEYTYANALIVRSGFDSAERYDERSGFSLGAGFKISHHSLDYAYNVNSVLGGTHQFSFVLRFGNPRKEKYYSNQQDARPSSTIVASEEPGAAPGPIIIADTIQPAKSDDGNSAASDTGQLVTSNASDSATMTADKSVAVTTNRPVVTITDQPAISDKGNLAASDMAQLATSNPDKSAAVATEKPVTAVTVAPVTTIPDKPVTTMTDEPVAPKIDKRTSRLTGKPATTKSDKHLYLICAGRYGTRADAEKYAGALEKFGYSARVEMVGQNDFRVVLAKESNRSKAEKKMKEFTVSGISCFIEEK